MSRERSTRIPPVSCPSYPAFISGTSRSLPAVRLHSQHPETLIWRAGGVCNSTVAFQIRLRPELGSPILRTMKCYNCGDEAQLIVAEDVPVCVSCNNAGPKECRLRHALKVAREGKSPKVMRAAAQSQGRELWNFERSA